MGKQSEVQAAELATPKCQHALVISGALEAVGCRYATHPAGAVTQARQGDRFVQCLQHVEHYGKYGFRHPLLP